MTTPAATLAAEPDASRAEGHGAEGHRNDIQALRALAVASVVLFHLWPTLVPGGYVGVDVFFVISGFLITSHLFREIEVTGTIRFASFWARRAKRLLPAGLLVLLVTALATILLVPIGRWGAYLNEVIASTWYVENWSLATKAVDYLAADAPPSPAQQFWSLSVEEQFYFGLPLLLVAARVLARILRANGRRSLVLTLSVITTASFVYGIWLTCVTPPSAYFSTFGRAWEFGVGALVAFIPGIPTGRARRVLAWAGIAGVIVACWRFSPSIAFPGYAAALPVLATALVLLAHDADHRGSVGHIGSLALPSFLGRSSYSIYLCHWPLLVLVPVVTGVPLALPTKLLVAVGTLMIAFALTRYVEEPVRFNPSLLGGSRSPRVVGTVSLLGMMLVTAVAWGALMVNATRAHELAASTASIVASQPDCFGAAARAPHPVGCPNPSLVGLLVPDPSIAAKDQSNRAACWSGTNDSDLRVCSVGPSAGFTRHLFAVGDSHSNLLLAAYVAIARERNWRIDVAGHNGCYWTSAHQVKPTSEATTACSAWISELQHYLQSHDDYDAVLTTYGYSRSSVVAAEGETEQTATVSGLQDAWREVLAKGIPVIAINDVPVMRPDVVACVDQHRSNPTEACSWPRARALAPFNGLKAAVKGLSGATLVDLSDFYCDSTTCLPVVGNVLVYADHDHITATFSRTLATYLGISLAAQLAGPSHVASPTPVS